MELISHLPMHRSSFNNLMLVVMSIFSPWFLLSSSSHAPVPPLLGVHPLDEKHYAGEVIQCRDRSKFFPRDRLNDNFCDCLDGTDEPGTPACPLGQFYCKNVGSLPKFIPSSHVNDHVCDCCDGSDEYGGSIKCPNNCIMGGNVEYKLESHVSQTQTSVIDKKENQNGTNKDSLPKLEGLKFVIVLQVILVSILFVLWMCHRRRKGKRRRAHASSS